MARSLEGHRHTFRPRHFLSCGYFVTYFSTNDDASEHMASPNRFVRDNHNATAPSVDATASATSELHKRVRRLAPARRLPPRAQQDACTRQSAWNLRCIHRCAVRCEPARLGYRCTLPNAIARNSPPQPMLLRTVALSSRPRCQHCGHSVDSLWIRRAKAGRVLL